ncbi:MAG: polyprenyl synthetase family protein, partial [Paludibacteraceae bacterium]|nr:polyprenyl synthetase family protein [Paludibacteraceae bacterium]
YYSALVLELLHNTTLIHDDVVDEAQIRRGQPSINKEFGNKVAVLAGDYLLAQIFWLANMIGERKILKAVSELGKELSDGEILQLMHTGDPDFAVQRYIEVITKKTAVLFSTCMYAGAVSSGKVDDKTCETLRSFGNDLGICFQMKDDIFDYSYASEQIGKPVGNDIREKKITLPLIYAYAAADQEEKAKMDTMLKSEDNLSEEQVRWVVDLVRRHNGVEKTEQKMKEYQASALEKIDVAEGECRDSLVEMLRYVAERDK